MLCTKPVSFGSALAGSALSLTVVAPGISVTASVHTTDAAAIASELPPQDALHHTGMVCFPTARSSMIDETDVRPHEHPYLKRCNDEELYQRLTRAVKNGGSEGERAYQQLLQLTEGVQRDLARSAVRKYGVDLNDMMQAARIGVLRAAEDFDPFAGRQFRNYARWLIQSEIRNEIAGNGWGDLSVVKMRHFMAIRSRMKERLGCWPSLPDLAKEAGVSLKKALELSMVAFSRFQSLDAPIGNEADGDALHEVIAADIPTPEEALVRSAAQLYVELDPLLKTLNERERRVLSLMFGLDDEEARELNFREVGEQIQLSGEMVRRIYNQALEKLRERAGVHLNGESALS